MLSIALLVLSGVGCHGVRVRPSGGAAIIALDSGYGTLRADFTRDAGHPHLLVVVSPT